MKWTWLYLKIILTISKCLRWSGEKTCVKLAVRNGFDSWLTSWVSEFFRSTSFLSSSGCPLTSNTLRIRHVHIRLAFKRLFNQCWIESMFEHHVLLLYVCFHDISFHLCSSNVLLSTYRLNSNFQKAHQVPQKVFQQWQASFLKFQSPLFIHLTFFFRQKSKMMIKTACWDIWVEPRRITCVSNPVTEWWIAACHWIYSWTTFKNLLYVVLNLYFFLADCSSTFIKTPHSHQFDFNCKLSKTKQDSQAISPSRWQKFK